MSWRPKPHIRVIAIAVIRRHGRMLLTAVSTDDGQVTGWRPPGGGMEFGETAEQTLVREFREEFGVTLNVGPRLAAIENHYTHEGDQGHEIVFVHEASIAAHELQHDDEFTFNENGDVEVARWIEIGALTSNQVKLFPRKLLSLL